MIAILVITICILAVYCVFLTIHSAMQSTEIELLNGTVCSIGQSYREASEQEKESGLEILRQQARIAELEAAAKSLLECFEAKS